MQSLYQFTIMIAALSVISILYEFLSPDGNMQKSVSIVIGIVYIGVIAQYISVLLSGRL